MDKKEINNIYLALSDEQSKMIFEKRVKYSETQDMKYLDDLIVREILRYKDKDPVWKLLEIIKDRTVWVFGAGFAGRSIVHALQLFGKNVAGVLDNNCNMWGSDIFGAAVFNPEKFNSFNDLVVIGTNKFRGEIREQLRSIGVPEENIYEADDTWWLGPYVQYFDKDIIKPKSNGIFVDGGSLDGGDCMEYTKYFGNDYNALYAFEPDPLNQEQMGMIAKTLHDFHFYKAGLWSKRTELRFSSERLGCSSMSENGDIMVNVDSIDNVLANLPVTYIKLDIEGSELEALHGAEKTIYKNKPVLAICVYHKPEDIIEIPNYILSLHLGYKLYLRHYSYLDTETVLYAV